MSDKTKRIVIFAVVLIAVIAVVSFFFRPVYVSGNGTAVFHYDGIDIEEPLSESESAAIAKIVNGHFPHFDMPACGFSNQIGIRFSGQTISIACDNCPTLSVHGMYFQISEGEAAKFRSIMRAHGASFPCV